MGASSGLMGKKRSPVVRESPLVTSQSKLLHPSLSRDLCAVLSERILMPEVKPPAEKSMREDELFYYRNRLLPLVLGACVASTATLCLLLREHASLLASIRTLPSSPVSSLRRSKAFSLMLNPFLPKEGP